MEKTKVQKGLEHPPNAHFVSVPSLVQPDTLCQNFLGLGHKKPPICVVIALFPARVSLMPVKSTSDAMWLAAADRSEHCMTSLHQPALALQVHRRSFGHGSLTVGQDGRAFYQRKAYDWVIWGNESSQPSSGEPWKTDDERASIDEIAEDVRPIKRHCVGNLKALKIYQQAFRDISTRGVKMIEGYANLQWAVKGSKTSEPLLSRSNPYQLRYTTRRCLPFSYARRINSSPGPQ